MDEIKTPPTY